MELYAQVLLDMKSSIHILLQQKTKWHENMQTGSEPGLARGFETNAYLRILTHQDVISRHHQN